MKPIRYYVIGGITAGLLTCVAINTHAQTAGVPRQISYQGVLREGDKVPADGMYSVTLALYDKATGGQPLWQETQTVEVKGGLFNIILGQYVPLSAPLPADTWIGVSFNSMGEMPRTKLTSVPYTFNAVTAQSLMPNATGAVLSLNGQQGALELRAADGFEVRADKGVLTIGKSSQAKEDETLNQGTEWLLAGNSNANANSWLGTSNNIPLVVRTSNTERMRILSSNGNVGIGETNPSSRLSVARTLHITNTGGTPELKLSAPSGANSTTFKTTGQSANITYTLPPDDGDANDVLISNGSGVLTWADNGWLRDGNSNITSNKFIGTTNNQPFIVKTNNIERYRVTGGGAMGINEDNPTQKLEVAGNILVKVDGNNTGEIRFQEPPGFMGSNYVGLKAGSVVNNIVFTLPSSYPTQPGQVLSSSPSGVMTWITPDDGGGGSGLLYFEESRHTSSPNDGLPAHRFAAIGADNNIDVVLSPKGVGSLMAQLPDDTDAGGFKRGWRSVDWQMVRTDASGVAGGDFSVISGGAGNSVYGGYSVVSGGFLNVVEGTASNISGGTTNTVAFDAENSGIVSGLSNRIGGNESGSQASSILGGVGNQIYGDNTSILGGRGLTLDGSGSFGFHANYYDDHFESEDYTRDIEIEENNTAVFGNVDLWLANNDGNPRSLRFYEQYDAPGVFPNGSSYVGFRAPNSIASDVTWTLPDADGTSGQVLSTDGSGVLSWVTASSGLQYFTEARNTAAPNATVPVHQFAASGAEDDIDITLSPKGDGAIAAQVADETAAGGNKRGANAVDWQMVRSNASEVASGLYSVIGGGQSNTTSGLHAAIIGGSGNIASDLYSTVGAGSGNAASGAYSFVGGGSLGVSSGLASTVAAGSQNTASGDYSTVSGGQLNIASGNYSTIPGGRGLTLSGSGSVGYLGNNAGGNNMTVSATNTAILGNVDLWLANNDNTPRSLRFYEQNNSPGAFPGGSNYVGFRAANSIASDVTWTLPEADGASGQVLSTNGSGTLSWASTGLQYFTEARYTSAPNAAVPVHQFVASGVEGDIDLALTPKGQGALTVEVADNTITGGNKRGLSSVDLQSLRANSSEVASGDFSTISGGVRNTASGYISTVSGGAGNSVTDGFSVISGGEANTVSGAHSTIPGGRGLTLDASADRSFGFHGNTSGGTRDMTISDANTAVFGNVDLWLANNDNTPRSLRFYEQYNTAGAYPNGANYVGFRAPNSIAADVTWTLPDADGTSGQVLSTNGSGVLSWNTIALQYFTEARNTTAPNATRPVHQFAASGTGTDIDIALTPKGAGALTAQIADGTTTGGNKRGLGAVDWQMGRFDATQVASTGYSTIGGGLNNTASGDAATIAGGGSNTASGFMSFIGGGNANTAGGIVATVAGGVNNTATIGAHYSSIGGGNNNTTEGNGTTVSGGFDNTASGDYSTVLGGRGLTLSGSGSVGYLGNNTTGANDMVVTASNTAAFANVDLWIVNNDNTAHELRIYEASGSGSNYTAFRAADQAMDVTYTLPTGDGADGQMLTTNGAGQLSWRDAIPCGSIIMWTGDINNVPTGWALCDGTGGTPDLNDRFPRGTTNAANVGTQGGSDSHLHTVDDHDHALTNASASGTIDDGSVIGSIGTSATGITASGTIDNGTDITTDGTTNNYSSNVTINVNDPGHDHSFSGSLQSTSVSVNLSGSTDTASGVGTSTESNVPAYVYVGYIMKVCPVIP